MPAARPEADEDNPAGTVGLSSSYSDRAIPPEETWRRVEPLLWQHGITRLARLTGLDRIGIPVWNAVAPNARSIVINQGKGITDIDARVSAAMEALERAVAGQPDIERCVASLSGLRSKGKFADPLNALVAARQSDLGENETVAWVEGRNLADGAAVWLPYDAVVLDRTVRSCRFWQSSDGLASGNSPEEAMFHGLLERVERDAEVLWQFRSTAIRHARCIDPASFRDPILDDLLARIVSAGLHLRLFDMTSDIGVPCIVALLAERAALHPRSAHYLHVTNGSGAHPVAIRAAIRAVTEAAQSRLTFISGARDDIDPANFDRPLPEPIRLELLAEPRACLPATRSRGEGVSDLLTHLIADLARVGIDRIYAVPLTAPDMAFSVVKVVVPGLENPAGARRRPLGARAISRALDPR
jgi:YcaO-like protein with predicted kinase domain